MFFTIKLRSDSESNWISKNPVLAKGEQGRITDAEGNDIGSYKVGNGISAWSDLPLFSGTDPNAVTGPAAATAGNFAALDATGKVLSDSNVGSYSFEPAGMAMEAVAAHNIAVSHLDPQVVNPRPGQSLVWDALNTRWKNEPAVRFIGVFDPDMLYRAGDVVMHAGRTYIAETPPTELPQPVPQSPGGWVEMFVDIATLTYAATDKQDPADTDEIPLSDSADLYSLKKLSWANIKATLTAYFDGLYASVVHPHTAADIGADPAGSAAERLKWRGNWSGTVAYEINDCVLYKGTLYVRNLSDAGGYEFVDPAFGSLDHVLVWKIIMGTDQLTAMLVAKTEQFPAITPLTGEDWLVVSQVGDSQLKFVTWADVVASLAHTHTGAYAYSDITISGTATSNGNIQAWVDGAIMAFVQVFSGEDAAGLAVAVVAAINDAHSTDPLTWPYTASIPTDGVVRISAATAGSTANGVMVRLAENVAGLSMSPSGDIPMAHGSDAVITATELHVLGPVTGITAADVGAEPAKSRRYAVNSTVSTTSYCGTAAAGSATSVAVWTISRLSASGNAIIKTTATSVAWDNRESVTYA